MNPAEVDRLRELANIGAGHAATAFAQLAGRPMRMQVPRVRSLEADPSGELARRSGTTGILFEFDGCLEALVAILFETSECEAVVRRLLGGSEGAFEPEQVQSALMELGNILASHVASAIADTLGSRCMPSVPSLSMGDADRALTDRARHRPGSDPIRIECQLTDELGELGGLLVVIPN